MKKGGNERKKQGRRERERQRQRGRERKKGGKELRVSKMQAYVFF